jgi:chromosome segregation protein
VGPNGAGKSNIGDAISFALGIATTKTLRAKNLSYLIFSKNGQKAGHAYVEVHFKNGGVFPVEEEQIVISRKVSRDGRSVFRINGKAVRERDLKDFLSKAGIYDNGYNVVLQGDIVKFLKMTPVERRKVIEDVAGISEYEQKKEKALKDLAEVNMKIAELRTLLEELKIQLEELREEKERLERYEKLMSEKKLTEAQILIKELQKERQQEEKIRNELQSLEERIKELKVKLEARARVLKEKEGRLKEVERELEPYREKYYKSTAQIDHLEEEIKKLNLSKATLLKEKQDEDSALDSLKKELFRVKEEVEGIWKDLKIKAKELEALEKEEREAYSKLKELDDRLKVSLEEAHRTEERERKLKEHLDSKRREEGDLRVEIKEIEAKIERTREDIGRLLEEREERKKKLEESADEIERLRRTRAVERDMLRKAKEKLRKLESQLKEVRDRIEEVIRGRAYVESKLLSTEPLEVLFDKIEGVYGTVGDLITVKDPDHIRAVEVAGGGRLRFVVVDNEDTAKRCIEYLKKNDLGRMSFIPLNKIKADFKLPPYPRVKGAVDFAINLVEYDERFEKAVRFAFGDTLIVEDFESAKRIGIGTYRMVTLEGELFDKSGVITGGSQKTGGELGRKFYEEEKKKLERDEAELREREKDIQLKIKSLRSEITEREATLKVLDERLSQFEEIAGRGDGDREFEERIAKAEEYIKILEEQKRELEEKLKKIREDIDYAQEKLRNLSLKRQDIISYYRASGIEEKRQEYERIKRRAENRRRELDELRLSFKTKEMEVKNLEKEISEKERKLKEIAEQIERKEGEITQAKRRKSELEKSLFTMEKKAQELYQEKDELEEQIGRIKAEIGRLRIEEEDLIRKEGEVKALLSRVEQRISDLEMRFEEIGYEGEVPAPQESITKLRERLSRIEKDLQALGNVNMRARENYEEKYLRFKEYDDRHKQLQEEAKAIRNMIEEIETKKLKTFMETYKHINRNLKKTFAFLSPGGRAEMMIENEVDPFSGGINLIVKPRGKDVQYLEAMSGGEKTLAALALIFAIQEYKPSPFYYFDEVDASLDEANTRRVGELIREKSKEAQFIVVSHREVIANFADRLIGVTARGGISRVFPIENLSALVAQEETAS